MQRHNWIKLKQETPRLLQWGNRNVTRGDKLSQNSDAGICMKPSIDSICSVLFRKNTYDVLGKRTLIVQGDTRNCTEYFQSILQQNVVIQCCKRDQKYWNQTSKSNIIYEIVIDGKRARNIWIELWCLKIGELDNIMQLREMILSKSVTSIWLVTLVQRKHLLIANWITLDNCLIGQWTSRGNINCIITKLAL